jgi:nitroreductase
METREAILTRRSIRAYRPEPIKAEDMQYILEAAYHAPSGGNAQPWAFVSVQEPRRLQGLRTLAPGMIATPAAAVVICMDINRTGGKNEEGKLPYVWMGLGAAMQNMLLAAHDRGLGACAIASFHAQGVSGLLKLPETLEPVLIISFGLAARIPKAPSKRPTEEIIFQEQYGGERSK